MDDTQNTPKNPNPDEEPTPDNAPAGGEPPAEESGPVPAGEPPTENAPMGEPDAEDPNTVLSFKDASQADAPAAAIAASVPPIAFEDPAPASHPTIRLDRKHPLAIRWMHWVNFPVLFIMIWSGVMIYWNDSDNAYKHPHEVYRVGIGSFTLFRFFPPWFYNLITVHGPYHVTEGLAYHFFFMWVFAINGIAYVLFTILSGEWRFIVPQRKSLIEAIRVTLVDLHILKTAPEQTKYNAAQRIAYTSVVLMGAGSLITGLSIYKPTQLHWITTMLGGYEMARWEHFWLTMGFCGFFVVHIVQVVIAGWNNFCSMISGLEIQPVDKPSLEAERRSWS